MNQFLNAQHTWVTLDSEALAAALLEAVDAYVSFVIGEIEEAKRQCADPVFSVEQKVDISDYVPDCFGTADMVNFANALHGLNDNQKIRLFRQQPTMLDWYEKVAYVTDRVTDFLQSAQTANSYPAGTNKEEAKEDGA